MVCLFIVFGVIVQYCLSTPNFQAQQEVPLVCWFVVWAQKAWFWPLFAANCRFFTCTFRGSYWHLFNCSHSIVHVNLTLHWPGTPLHTWYTLVLYWLSRLQLCFVSLNLLIQISGDVVTLPDGTRTLVRCIILCGTFHAPAKCLFQTMSQFNRNFACPYCLHPGETVKTAH